MSLNELTSASCINIIHTKCDQVSIPLLYLSVSCFLTTLENLDRLINPSICAKRLILVLDMVFGFYSTLKLGKISTMSFLLILFWTLLLQLIFCIGMKIKKLLMDNLKISSVRLIFLQGLYQGVFFQ